MFCSVTYSDPKICQKACDDADKCKAWTLVPAEKCCLKGKIPMYKKDAHSSTFTSGVKNPGGPMPAPGTSTELQLSPNDKSISLSVYVDNTFSEAFWQGGRVAMTVVTPASKQASVAAFSTKDATVSMAQVFAVNSIWVSPEEVLNS